MVTRVSMLWLTLGAPSAWASAAGGAQGPTVGGVPFEFFLFVATLVGVAMFHHHTLQVAVGGFLTIATYKVAFTGFDLVPHLGHEWVILANLFGLLTGFGLLADHFERSNTPEHLPKFLPDDWKGGLALLWLVFAMSGFLDNIAAAMIGGTIAMSVFKGKVHIGYLAAIVAASNAGGAGSVVGDTTTTMMWLAGASPLDVLPAYLAAAPALLIVGTFAARQQHAYQPIQKDPHAHVAPIDWARMGVVALILGAAVAANVGTNVYAPHLADGFPILACAIWGAIVAGSAIRPATWSLLPESAKGSVFLLSLVLCASMMPVEELPPATWYSTLAIGFISAIFDNIPLTALALQQGGYDWSMLAFAVGYGGSMVWFGSSAGVALSNTFPQMRDARAYIRAGWHVPVGYVAGFMVLGALAGWNPPAAPDLPIAGPDDAPAEDKTHTSVH
jgi:Na+/H+ antiporter NhaD/arsenite permease-like protein